MSLLVLVRHGRAAFGADRYDTLSDLGRAQAAATGAWLAAHRPGIATLWQGPRRRHAETAAEITREGSIAAPVRVHAGLDEFGEGEELLALAEARGERWGAPGEDGADLARRRAYDRAIAAWAAGEGEIPGRPDFSTFRGHVRDWFTDVVTIEASRGRTELAVTSAGVIAAVVCETLGLDDERWLDLLRALANTSLTEIAFSGGRHGLRCFNAHGHLAPDLVTAI
ncbi:MAG: histidine phosphatase family protein [Phyllobacteriaceae bacterium]|nr:histidine phosphatase family protein [Phyllobacteriaceae bacterium]